MVSCLTTENGNSDEVLISRARKSYQFQLV